MSEEGLHFWDPWLSGTAAIHNTEELFIHASRPYWEFYRNEIDEMFLCDAAPAKVADSTMSEIISGREANKTLWRDEIAWEDNLKSVVAAFDRKDVLLITTKKRASSFRQLVNRKYPNCRSAKIILLPDLVARLEVEPGWHIVQEFVRDWKPGLVIMSLGWEKIVYASRFKKWCDSVAVDIGEVKTSEQKIKEYKNILKAKIKLLLAKS